MDGSPAAPACAGRLLPLIPSAPAKVHGVGGKSRGFALLIFFFAFIKCPHIKIFRREIKTSSRTTRRKTAGFCI